MPGREKQIPSTTRSPSTRQDASIGSIGRFHHYSVRGLPSVLFVHLVGLSSNPRGPLSPRPPLAKRMVARLGNNTVARRIESNQIQSDQIRSYDMVWGDLYRLEECTCPIHDTYNYTDPRQCVHDVRPLQLSISAVKR